VASRTLRRSSSLASGTRPRWESGSGRRVFRRYVGSWHAAYERSLPRSAYADTHEKVADWWAKRQTVAARDELVATVKEVAGNEDEGAEAVRSSSSLISAALTFCFLVMLLIMPPTAPFFLYPVFISNRPRRSSPRSSHGKPHTLVLSPSLPKPSLAPSGLRSWRVSTGQVHGQTRWKPWH